MFFTTPIWLLGLLPWAAVAAAVLLGRRPRRDVPFLPLWQGPAAVRSPARRRLTVPPAAVVLALLSALAGVLAAAGPATRRPGTGAVVVIVDTGVTMSSRSAGTSADDPAARRRFCRGAADVAAALARHAEATSTGGDVVVTVVDVPRMGRARVTVADLVRYVEQLPGHATDIRDPLARAVARELADPAATAVLVVTDGPVPGGDPRVVRVAPPTGGRSLGIRAFAVRRSPRPQAMVRLATETWGVGDAAAGADFNANRPAFPAEATVRVTAGGAAVDRVVPVPPPGETRDVFLDLPAVAGGGDGDSLSAATASLIGWDDDLPADDRADLTAEFDWPGLEPAAPVGDLRRLVDLYGRSRPPGGRSVPVRLANDPATLGTAAGVVLPPAGTPAPTTRAATVVPHPVTVAVADWPTLDVPAVVGRSPPDGFATILSDSAGPLVAVREVGGGVGPGVRQAWTAIAGDGWANTPQYVAFFSALFDWVGRAGDGAEELKQRPLADLTAEWEPVELAPALGPVAAWPGVYRRRGDGLRGAFGPAELGRAVMTKSGSATAATAASRLDDALRAGDREVAWAPWLAAAALVAACGAASSAAREGGSAEGFKPAPSFGSRLTGRRAGRR